jgi:hypothetical protein
MRSLDPTYNFRIVLDAKHCAIPPMEWEKMLICLSPLDRATQTFPFSDLYITINHHPRTHAVHVKTSLVLSGKTLFTGDRSDLIYAAFERCIRKLVNKVQAYKQDLSETAEVSKHEKRTHQDVEPSVSPDPAVIDAAVANGDYRAFRIALYGYEEPLRKRIGRWIERFPDIQAQIGQQFTVADLVEEVFLNAFDQYDHRPREIRLGDWLEHLIDPSVKALLLHPDEERENIRFAQTITETTTE